MNTTWEVADVRKPLISANRLLERGHKLVLDEKPRIQCKNGDTIPLERTGSLFAYYCGFQRVFTGRPEHEPRQEKRACKTTHQGEHEKLACCLARH